MSKDVSKGAKFIALLFIALLLSVAFCSVQAQSLQRDTSIIEVEVEENVTTVTYQVLYPCWQWDNKESEFMASPGLVMEECEERFQLWYPHDKGRFKRPVQKYTGITKLDTIYVPKYIKTWEYHIVKDSFIFSRQGGDTLQIIKN